MRICVLGWGSLLWDEHPTFDSHHGAWERDGPKLRLEFSRISETRLGALTLVLDATHGAECQVAYADSTRNDPEDAICDLRSREGTVRKRIGFMFLDGSRAQGGDEVTRQVIKTWAAERKADVVIWTNLPSNFEKKKGRPFSLDEACKHLQALSPEGKARAAEYVWRAPDFVVTPLKLRLQQEPWFVLGQAPD